MKPKSHGSFIRIGSSHENCQDFAIAGKINDTLSYAILTDGCSMSHDKGAEVDFGARMLCYAARKAVKDMYSSTVALSGGFPDWEIQVISRNTLEICLQQISAFALNPSAIDATLLICVSDGNCHRVVLFGDGGFVYMQDKEMCFTHVEYHSGAPFYLRYLTIPRGAESYFNSVGGDLIEIVKMKIDESGKVTNETQSVNNVPDISFYNQTSFVINGPTPFVALTSDGVKTFKRPHAEYNDIFVNLEPKDIIRDMFGFKNLNDGFVERRMNRFIFEANRDKMLHTDDISVAAISFGL